MVQIQHELAIASQLNFRFTIEHVKGHQDNFIPSNELSRQAQLNVKADSYATNYLSNGKIVSYDELMCANPASFYLEDHIINRTFKHQMRSASRSPELRHYMIGKFEWHPNTPNLIWWYSHGKSISSFSKADQRRIR